MENMLKTDINSIEEVYRVIKAIHDQINEIGVDSLANETKCSKVLVESFIYTVAELKNALEENSDELNEYPKETVNDVKSKIEDLSNLLNSLTVDPVGTKPSIDIFELVDRKHTLLDTVKALRELRQDSYYIEPFYKSLADDYEKVLDTLDEIFSEEQLESFVTMYMGELPERKFIKNERFTSTEAFQDLEIIRKRVDAIFYLEMLVEYKEYEVQSNRLLTNLRNELFIFRDDLISVYGANTFTQMINNNYSLEMATLMLVYLKYDCDTDTYKETYEEETVVENV